MERCTDNLVGLEKCCKHEPSVAKIGVDTAGHGPRKTATQKPNGTTAARGAGGATGEALYGVRAREERS